MPEPIEYEFKTQPYAHQRRAFEATARKTIAAYFMEMGTGKSKVVIDCAAFQYEGGWVDAILVIAPGGVAGNWVDREIPTHLPDRITRTCVVWRSGKMSTRVATEALADLIVAPGLVVLAINVEAVLTVQGEKYLDKFLTKRQVFAVIDESIIIKSPGAARTKRVVALMKRARSRRICSGAPVTQGPFDLYAQFNALRPGLLGFTSFTAFKHRYGEWDEGYNPALNRTYPILKQYRNEDELLAKIAPYVTRANKDDCLDLPPKVYERRPFTLAPEQRKLYDKLRDEYVAELAAMETVTVAHALTRLLRLQQVTSGYWPETRFGIMCSACQGEGCPACDDLGIEIRVNPLRALVTGTNPRVTALLDVIAEVDPARKVIVWCRFVRDCDEVINALGGPSICVRYDGTVNADLRRAALEEFQNGVARFFVGTPRAGGRGLTLTAASVVVNYSHDFSYEVRAQSEDRAHRIGQTRSVTYVDLEAEDTVDAKILDVIATKKDYAAMFSRDPPSKWL